MAKLPSTHISCVANTTFKHHGNTFMKGVAYGIHKDDTPYFKAVGWMSKSNLTPEIIIGRMGYDKDTVYAFGKNQGKKVMDHPVERDSVPASGSGAKAATLDLSKKKTT